MARARQAGLVWIVSGGFLLLYSGFGLVGFNIPGVEELVTLATMSTGYYLYLAGFLSIFLEGLYVVGNFVPGSTLVLMLAMLAGIASPTVFFFTILSIFLGWCLAGAVNIFIAARLLAPAPTNLASLKAQDRFLTTWYPAFRANYEVAQVASGIPLHRVWWSSVRVKMVASLGAGIYALILPFFFDIKNTENTEGFAIVFAIAFLCIGIGCWQIWHNRSPKAR